MTLVSGMALFGGAPQVRRNAINLQLIADPLSTAGLQLVSAAVQLYMQGGPVRIGAFFTPHLCTADAPGTVAFADMPLHCQFARCVTLPEHHQSCCQLRALHYFAEK